VSHTKTDKTGVMGGMKRFENTHESKSGRPRNSRISKKYMNLKQIEWKKVYICIYLYTRWSKSPMRIFYELIG